MVALSLVSNTPVMYLKMETKSKGISKAAINLNIDKRTGPVAIALPKIRTKVNTPKRMSPFLAPILFTITGAKIINMASSPT